MSKPNIDLSNMDPVMYAEYMKKEQKKKRKKTILVTFLSVFIAIIAIAGIANVLSGDAPQKVDGSNVNGSSVSTTQDYFQVGDVVN